MSADFTNFSEISASECMCPTCVNNRLEAADRMNSAVKKTPGDSDFMGFKARAEAAARMKAATCKCGHVGAECFNDEYCTPVNDAAKFWRNAFRERSDTATQVEIAMANKIAELEGEINDLQADYASDCIAWSKNFNTLNDMFFDDTQVEELETTIKVLARMVS